MQTYYPRDTVKARKVTDKAGETVVTGNGPVSANKGDYVVHRQVKGIDPVSGETVSALVVSVMDADAFNATYKGSPGRGGGESQRTRKSAAKRASSSASKSTQSKSTASQRVRAARK